MKIVATDKITIEQLISLKMKDISKTRIKQWLKFGQVSVNGKAASRIDELLNPNDVLELNFNKPAEVVKAFKPTFKVLFEDKSIIVALKPAGLVSSGDAGDRRPSFFKVVQQYVRENSKGHEKLFVVHRLDREVSGVIMFAKTEVVQQSIKNNWKENHKAYIALVEGDVKNEKGMIENYLAEDPKTLKVYSTKNPAEDGAKHAITHYTVQKRLKNKTLLEVVLETGRKNQIRVHLSEMGHPIVGDRRYGADDTFERQIRLFAYHLKFQHPVTKKWIEIKEPLPSHFLHLPEKDEKYK